MNIRKKIIIIGALIFVSSFTGCVSNSIEGTYLLNSTKAYNGGFTEPVSISVQIFPDDSFFYKDLNTGESYSGIVKQQGEKYIFTGSLISFSGKIIDGNLSIEGNNFVKQKR